MLSEACAFSLAEDSILILDQLQAADFRDQIRIYQLLQSGVWQTRDCTNHANPRHLLVVLISEQELYHSLRKSSFRIWVNRISEQAVDYRPEEFGLAADAEPMMAALAELFGGLGVTPTRSEYSKLLQDVGRNVRTGTFDFFLAQPGNPLFMISTRKIELDALINAALGLGR